MAEEKNPEPGDEQTTVDGEAGEGASVDAVSSKAKKKKLIILAAAGVVGLLLAGGGAVFFLTGGSKHHGDERRVAGPELKSKPAYYALGDMIVNLSGEGRRPNYLKVKVVLELADEKDSSLMDLIKPRIVDNFQVYLRELRIEDLRGSAGMYRLREELLMRVTEAAQPVRIRDVLFQEMLVQ